MANLHEISSKFPPFRILNGPKRWARHQLMLNDLELKIGYNPMNKWLSKCKKNVFFHQKITLVDLTVPYGYDELVVSDTM